MAPKNQKPPPQEDDGEGKTAMLDVRKRPAPAQRKAAPTADPEPGSDDDVPGGTAMLNVGDELPPPPPPRARKAAPRPEPEPEPEPAAQEELDEPATDPGQPAEEEAVEDSEQPTFQKPRKPAPRGRQADDEEHPTDPPSMAAGGATQMLDIRNMPTPEEMRQQARKAAREQPTSEGDTRTVARTAGILILLAVVLALVAGAIALFK
jgi:hypothetical protein